MPTLNTLEYCEKTGVKTVDTLTFMNHIVATISDDIEAFTSIEGVEAFFREIGLKFTKIMTTKDEILKSFHDAMGQHPACIDKTPEIMIHGCESERAVGGIMARGVLANLGGKNLYGVGGYATWAMSEALKYAGQQEYRPQVVLALLSVHTGMSRDGKFFEGRPNDANFEDRLVNANAEKNPTFVCMKHVAQGLPLGYCVIESIGFQNLTAGMIVRRAAVWKNHSFMVESQKWLDSHGGGDAGGVPGAGYARPGVRMFIPAGRNRAPIPVHHRVGLQVGSSFSAAAISTYGGRSADWVAVALDGTQVSAKNVSFTAGDNVVVDKMTNDTYMHVLSPDPAKNGGTVRRLASIGQVYFGAVKMTDLVRDQAVRDVNASIGLLLQTSSYTQQPDEMLVPLEDMTNALMAPVPFHPDTFIAALGQMLTSAVTTYVGGPAGAGGAAGAQKKRRVTTQFWCLSCLVRDVRPCESPSGSCCTVCASSYGKEHDADCQQKNGAAGMRA